MILAKARIVNYDSRIVIYSFTVMATVITSVNYDCTVITIVNYDPKTFLVQATGEGRSPVSPADIRLDRKCLKEALEFDLRQKS